MRVPLSWLKEYVSLDGISAEALAERLTTAGLEVAAIEYIGVAGPPQAEHLVWDPATIRVGEIISVEPHPNADRLRLVTVAYGADAPKTVVTGAPNVAAGMRVAYATTGATVINGYSEQREFVTLEPKKLRGILSEGMVLSERELGLSNEHEGILTLPEDAPVGQPLQSYLGDVVIEIELTPNMGRAASIVGVAREVAALLDRPLRAPEPTPPHDAPLGDALRIVIERPDLNPRFSATLIRGLTVAPSPAWMQRRLMLAGMRPISNIVDITNYVMIEWGQPLHAFDYDRLVERAQGGAIPTIRTRLARAGERLETLDGVERALRPEDILVTDDAGILALAGVMGGAATEVTASTTNVLLEAAAWDYISTRRTSTRHLLFSEAAFRFGRGVHPDVAAWGNHRAAALMAELAGGTVVGWQDDYPAPPAPVVLTIDAAQVNRTLGTALSAQAIGGYLRRLGFGVEPAGEALRVTTPNHRLDIAIPADLVEEVARVYGLDELPATLIDEAMPPLRDTRALTVEERIRDLLVGLGLSETISYYMTSPESEAALRPGNEGGDSSIEGFVALLNPISHERSVMRRTLLVSALENLQTNLRHRDRVALFEVGTVYEPQPGSELARESRRLLLALTGPREAATWHGSESGESDFYSLKGVVETLLDHLHLSDRARYVASDHPSFQPGRAATLLLDGEPAGTLGELHPLVRRAHGLPEQRVALAELALDALIAATPERFRVRPVPRYPAVMQDLAVIVDEATTADTVLSVIRSAGAEALSEVAIFDLYQGASIPEGKKSLAYALRYSHSDRTLNDGEVAQQHARITAALREQLGAQIRGEDGR